MEVRGRFSDTLQKDNGAHAGRVRWMLTPEGKGQEFDASAVRCTVVRARVVKGCADADKEEWDVLEPWDVADEVACKPRPKIGAAAEQEKEHCQAREAERQAETTSVCAQGK